VYNLFTRGLLYLKDYVIASGTCFYNDHKSLERTLESLKDKVDLMICVDGRFKHFKDGNDTGLSVDKSRELVRSYDHAVLIDMPHCYEIQKRQAYIDYCKSMFDDFRRINYLLIVDSDEYVLEYDSEKFEQEISIISGDGYHQYNVFAVMLEVNSGKYAHIVHKFNGGNEPQTTTPNNRQFAHSPRLWQRPYEMEYNMTHYNFRHKHPSSSLHYQETNCAVKIVSGIKLGHDHVLREDKHLDKRFQYQKWLVQFEQKKLRDYVHTNKKTPQIDEYDIIDHAS
jgi:hypothetical protein